MVTMEEAPWCHDAVGPYDLHQDVERQGDALTVWASLVLAITEVQPQRMSGQQSQCLCILAAPVRHDILARFEPGGSIPLGQGIMTWRACREDCHDDRSGMSGEERAARKHRIVAMR